MGGEFSFRETNKLISLLGNFSCLLYDTVLLSLHFPLYAQCDSVRHGAESEFFDEKQEFGDFDGALFEISASPERVVIRL